MDFIWYVYLFTFRSHKMGCVSKLRSNSAHPLSSIKTCHYQARLTEKCAVPLQFPKVLFKLSSLPIVKTHHGPGATPHTGPAIDITERCHSPPVTSTSRSMIIRLCCEKNRSFLTISSSMICLPSFLTLSGNVPSNSSSLDDRSFSGNNITFQATIAVVNNFR